VVDQNHPSHIETQSLISIEQLLFGSLPVNANTIGLAQIGGKVPPFDLSVAGDPVVQKGEQYVLFLMRDDRSLPKNTLGTARYSTYGVGTGKVKITDGKVQFSCSTSSPQLKKYDNTDVVAFINVLRDMIRLRKEGRL
jgi:hypothetical protein